jgi:hypothetical protein
MNRQWQDFLINFSSFIICCLSSICCSFVIITSCSSIFIPLGLVYQILTQIGLEMVCSFLRRRIYITIGWLIAISYTRVSSIFIDLSLDYQTCHVKASSRVYRHYIFLFQANLDLLMFNISLLFYSLPLWIWVSYWIAQFEL